MKEISAGGVVYFENNKNIQVLLIEDRCQKWTLPKGKIEEGETYQETALREIYEETGINGEIIKPLDKVSYDFYNHAAQNRIEKEVYFYLVKAKNQEINIQYQEINAAAWFTLDEAWEKQQTQGYDNNNHVMKKAFQYLGYHSPN